MTRTQRKSDAMKYGEGKTHTKARERLQTILKNDKWIVYPGAKLIVIPILFSENNEDLRNEERMPDFKHPYDIYAIKYHEYNLVTELIVEIQGSRHKKALVKNRDAVIKRNTLFYFPDAIFARIDIAVLLNQNISDVSILHMIKSSRQEELYHMGTPQQ